MTPGRFEAMLKAIVGYELTIEDLRGTRKLGQNKTRSGARSGAAAPASDAGCANSRNGCASADAATRDVTAR